MCVPSHVYKINLHEMTSRKINSRVLVCVGGARVMCVNVRWGEFYVRRCHLYSTYI